MFAQHGCKNCSFVTLYTAGIPATTVKGTRHLSGDWSNIDDSLKKVEYYCTFKVFKEVHKVR